MRISVRHVSQGASGGSFVVKYHADFDIAEPPDVSVTVANTVPGDADTELVEQARDSIRDGFIRVLKPLSLGADVVVRDLVIQDVDLKMGQYAKLTAHELEQFLRRLREEDPWTEKDSWSARPDVLRAIGWLLAALPLFFVGLHPSVPQPVSVVALLTGTYVMIFRCLRSAFLAAFLHDVNRKRQDEHGNTR